VGRLGESENKHDGDGGTPPLCFGTILGKYLVGVMVSDLAENMRLGKAWSTSCLLHPACGRVTISVGPSSEEDLQEMESSNGRPAIDEA
jgi:hypothetical protein